tara:strand:- start:35649 stop:36614 length:966 start_codon:yes stop_codon:yes gene_type:complete
MIILTGSNGFIGSNLLTELNKRGLDRIIAVDNHQDEKTSQNIENCSILEAIEIEEFFKRVKKEEINFNEVEAIFHQGACSNTMEWDIEFLYKNNVFYSNLLLDKAIKFKIPLIYASSASIYGAGTQFKEKIENESPINLYAYSKYLFDQNVRKYLGKNESQIVGLRYFNVYGPNEAHKESMASVAYHLNQQLKKGDQVNLFKGSDGFGDGQQKRDFIHVDDVVNVNLWFRDNSNVSGIFNVGTGKSQTFNEVANAVIEWNKRGYINYIDFPENLKGAYQSFTEADIGSLRKAGYTKDFLDVNTGVKKYLDALSGWPKNDYR